VRYGAIAAWHAKRARAADDELTHARVELDRVLNGAFPVGAVSISSRVKTVTSLFDKVVLRGKRADDLLALRVVVDDSSADGAMSCHQQCMAVGEVVHALWPQQKQYKDYIAKPKPNGYQSLHMQVQLGSGAEIEIQIRTWCMHEVAEHGSAAHALYKMRAGRNSVPPYRWPRHFCLPTHSMS